MPNALATVPERMTASDLQSRVSTQVADMNALPFADYSDYSGYAFYVLRRDHD